VGARPNDEEDTCRCLFGLKENLVFQLTRPIRMIEYILLVSAMRYSMVYSIIPVKCLL